MSVPEVILAVLLAGIVASEVWRWRSVRRLRDYDDLRARWDAALAEQRRTGRW